MYNSTIVLIMIGHIYRIIHIESDIQYVGSTLNEPRKRWQQHKGDYAKWLKGDHANIAIYPFIQEYDIDQFKLIVIKSYDVIDRKHLLAYEQLWMSKLTCVNKKNTIYIKKMNCMQYRSGRRDELNANAKQYREENKEIIKERQRRYRDQKKQELTEKRAIKHRCDCGIEFTHQHRARHSRSAKHQRWLENSQVQIAEPIE